MRCFAAAVAAAVDVIREVRPQVIVTYDDNGDYGHPTTSWRTGSPRPRSSAQPTRRTTRWRASRGRDEDVLDGHPEVACCAASRRRCAAGGPSRSFGVDDVEDLPFGVEDDEVTTVSSRGRLRRRQDGRARRARDPDHRRRADSSPCRTSSAARSSRPNTSGWCAGHSARTATNDGWECDLFAGLTI